MTDKPYDVVVFGATSFVGQILCRYLAKHFGLDGRLKWAAAARSRAKLETLRTDLGSGAANLTLLTADASDETSLRALCAQARVVISTVGPYALYGEPLVKLCAETGTDYCDLTGEVQWIRRMIDRYETTARSSGARIVNCCGFDSIPSDLGVAFLQARAVERFGAQCPHVEMRVKAAKGGVSGGTVASILNVGKEAASDPALRKELANPYSLCPPGSPAKSRQPSLNGAAYDSDFGAWRAPFIMASINTRVVHRTNALLDYPYGRDFRYGEAMITGRGLRGRTAAYGIMIALGGFVAASALSPSRWVLNRFLPAPGEGPTPEAQRNGFFDLRFLGIAADGQTIRTKVTGDADPGYGSTAKMLGQAGASLALDLPKSAKGGGFWTPASIFESRLYRPLQEAAGLTFTVLDRAQNPVSIETRSG